MSTTQQGTTAPPLLIIDLSALSWHYQVEEVYLHTFLIMVWYPDSPTTTVKFQGLLKGVWQEVEHYKKWYHYEQWSLAA